MTDQQVTVDDKVLEVWLKGTFLAAIKALGSPRWMEDCINQAFKQIPVGVLLEQGERLGIIKADDVRRMAQSVPDLPAKLRTDEGRGAVRSWGAQHQALPMLRSLRQATGEVHRLWQTTRYRNEAVSRGVGFIALGSVVIDDEGILTQLGGVLPRAGTKAGLLREYGRLVTSRSDTDIDCMDKVILDHPVLGRYIQDFTMKLGELSRPPGVATCWDFSQSPSSEGVAEVCSWLFRRR